MAAELSYFVREPSFLRRMPVQFEYDERPGRLCSAGDLFALDSYWYVGRCTATFPNFYRIGWTDCRRAFVLEFACQRKFGKLRANSERVCMRGLGHRLTYCGLPNSLSISSHPEARLLFSQFADTVTSTCSSAMWPLAHPSTRRSGHVPTVYSASFPLLAA